MIGTKEELIEHIEITLVELRGLAQPNEVAELNCLLLDARETDNGEQIVAIWRQVDHLREFCELRSMSQIGLPSVEGNSIR
jgi:hypothetical protein